MKNNVVKIKFVTYSCSIHLNGKLYKRISISNRTGDNILINVQNIIKSEMNIDKYEIYRRNEMLEVCDNYKNLDSFICSYCDM